MAGTKQTSGGSAGKVPPRPNGSRGAGATGATGARPVPPRGPGRAPSARPGGAAARPAARSAPRVSARQIAQRRRQRNMYVAGGGVAAVIIVIAVVLSIALTSSSNNNGKAAGTFALPVSLVASVENVPLSKLVSAAEACYKSSHCFGAAQSSGAAPAQKIPGPALVSQGKPEMLYIGAEYCPYCAAERWSMLMALSKFGKFGPILGTTSSATDVNASTPTFSFYHVKYSSPYLSFVPVEELTNTEAPLQKPTASQQATLAKYDAPPYISSQDAGSIPFVDIANKYLSLGNQYDGSAIAGMPIDSAAPYMTSGANATSKNAMAAAGFMVGDLCAVTHDQPAKVCSVVPANLKGINSTSSSSGHGSKLSKATPHKSGTKGTKTATS